MALKPDPYSNFQSHANGYINAHQYQHADEYIDLYPHLNSNTNFDSYSN